MGAGCERRATGPALMERPQKGDGEVGCGEHHQAKSRFWGIRCQRHRLARNNNPSASLIKHFVTVTYKEAHGYQNEQMQCIYFHTLSSMLPSESPVQSNSQPHHPFFDMLASNHSLLFFHSSSRHSLIISKDIAQLHLAYTPDLPLVFHFIAR